MTASEFNKQIAAGKCPFCGRSLGYYDGAMACKPCGVAVDYTGIHVEDRWDYQDAEVLLAGLGTVNGYLEGVINSWEKVADSGFRKYLYSDLSAAKDNLEWMIEQIKQNERR